MKQGIAPKPRVAFVVHRFARDLGGGIERHCQVVAEQMASSWEIEVITTCARDYRTWRNECPEGLEEVDGIRIRRFPSDSERDPASFARLTDEVLGSASRTPLEAQREWMQKQGPMSTPLFRYLEEESSSFDAFFFFSYLYATTCFGLERVGNRSALIPAAHDEPTLRLELFREVFANSGFHLFNTVEEKRLIHRRFPGLQAPFRICGVGPTGERWRHQKSVRPWKRPYLLYLGRIDRAKGCDQLFSYFLNPAPGFPSMDLLLVGRANMEIPDLPNVHALGYVGEERKWELLRGATALVMPSPYESLSLVLLESWEQGVPVIVNGRCDVLKGQCRRSGGGLPYYDVRSFTEAVRRFHDSPAERARMGLLGLHYVLRNYDWRRIREDYFAALRAIRQACEKRKGQ